MDVIFWNRNNYIVDRYKGDSNNNRDIKIRCKKIIINLLCDISRENRLFLEEENVKSFFEEGFLV